MQLHLPDAYKHLKELDAVIKTGLDPIQLEMIRIRASQLNGCAYCLNSHITDAIKAGEDHHRLNVLSAWREARGWFTRQEQVILQLTEQITMIGEQGISDEVYDQAVKFFGEKKTAHLIMAAVNINAWNRIGVGLNFQPLRY